MTCATPEIENIESRLEDLDNEWDIICDYAAPERAGEYHCGGDRAEWIGRARCPECGFSVSRLLCTACKDLVTTTEHGCRCGGCEARIVPWRKVFTYFTPLRAT